MSWLLILVGAVALASGYGIKSAMIGRKRVAVDSTVHCVCEHPISSHDRRGCHDRVSGEPIRWSYGYPIQWNRIKCPCKRDRDGEI